MRCASATPEKPTFPIQLAQQLQFGVLAEEGGALSMLEERLMATATAEIVAGERSRFDIQRDIKAKVCAARNVMPLGRVLQLCYI